jgi:intracellular sulfur oxidation DsrE/DsrF family protein
MRIPLVFVGLLMPLGFAGAWLWAEASSDPPIENTARQSISALPETAPGSVTERILFDLVGHSEQQLLSLMNRAKQMAERAGDDREALEIALVLHGPDIDFFATRNYQRYRTLVDLAAQLDAYDVIDFKACIVALRERGFAKPDIPAFIELVPFGPDEIRRLEQRGYITL